MREMNAIRYGKKPKGTNIDVNQAQPSSSVVDGDQPPTKMKKVGRHKKESPTEVSCGEVQEANTSSRSKAVEPTRRSKRIATQNRKV